MKTPPLSHRLFCVLFFTVVSPPAIFAQFDSDPIELERREREWERANDLESKGGYPPFGHPGHARDALFEDFVPPSKLTSDNTEAFFANMPEKTHDRCRDKLVELEATLNEFFDHRKELYLLVRSLFETVEDRTSDDTTYENNREDTVRDEFDTIYDQAYEAFTRYPDVYDPARKSDYWRESAEDFIEILDRRIAWLKKQEKDDAEEFKRLHALDPSLRAQALRPEQREHWLFSHLPDWTSASLDELPEKRRERLAAGKPAYVNPFLDCGPLTPSTETRLMIHAFMKHETGKPQSWPELESLGLTARDIEGWDGSTSLENMARELVAALCHGGIAPEYWTAAAELEPPKIHFRLDPFISDTPETKDAYRAAKENLHNNAIYQALAGRRFAKTHEAIVNVIEGRRKLSFSTRMPSRDELDLAEKNGVELLCTPFTQDAFVFLVNRYNPVENLTVEQIRDIYAGKLDDWNEAGGFGKIVALGRNRNSGSEELLREIVMKDVPVRDDLLDMIITSMQGVFDQLAASSGAIGYTVWYYERTMVDSSASRVIKVNGVQPTAETVASGEYPFAYQTVLIRQKPKADEDERTETFVRWMLGKEGQNFVLKCGYVPLDAAEPPKKGNKSPGFRQ